MKKSHARSTHIVGTVWPYDIVVSIGTTKSELEAYMDKKFVGALTETDRANLNLDGKKGYVLHLENNGFILWLKKFPTDPEWHGHLAHEIFHAADLILDKAGLKLTASSDEAWAYFIDWITREIYTRYSL